MTSRRMFTLLFCILGFPLSSALAEAEPSKVEKVRQKIKSANFCSKRTDCSEQFTMCPFGCSIRVNKSEFENIQKAISDGLPKMLCEYKCMATTEFDCFAGKCISLSPGDLIAKNLTAEQAIILARNKIHAFYQGQGKKKPIIGTFKADLRKDHTKRDCWFVKWTTRPNTPGGTTLVLVCSSERVHIIWGR